tara:strand:- start:172 stop:363 length:192 start_codon:yes stop_codon:yes gene_type:complete
MSDEKSLRERLHNYRDTLDVNSEARRLVRDAINEIEGTRSSLREAQVLLRIGMEKIAAIKGGW